MSWRRRLSIDPVLAAGTLLSIGLAVGFYFFHPLAPAMATLAGLIGVMITLQVHALARERLRAEQETKLGSILAKVEGHPWLPDMIDSMLTSVTKIERNFPGLPAIDVCRDRLETCRAELADLESGRFHVPYADNTLALRLCETMQWEFLAISVPAIDLTWWTTPEGRRYWRFQQEALRRGVAIHRIFIHDGWTEPVDQLAREQQASGVDVRRVQRALLPLGARGILGVWDRTCALEVIYDTSGEAVEFAYAVAEADVERLRRRFERVERMAVGIDEAEPVIAPRQRQ